MLTIVQQFLIQQLIQNLLMIQVGKRFASFYFHYWALLLFVPSLPSVSLLFGKRCFSIGQKNQFSFFRAQRIRKQMYKGPNKILLLPVDLVFVLPKGSIFTSRVSCWSRDFSCALIWFLKIDLRKGTLERSNVSIRSEEVQAGKTARYNVRFFYVERFV